MGCGSSKSGLGGRDSNRSRTLRKANPLGGGPEIVGISQPSYFFCFSDIEDR